MNYYNEFDPKAAAWLRELIKAGRNTGGLFKACEEAVKELGSSSGPNSREEI